MTVYYRYYLLDTVSETIIGHFFAKNERMAEKIMETFDFEKAHLDKSDVKLMFDQRDIPLFLTYDEVVNSEYCIESEILDQKVLEFGDDA